MASRVSSSSRSGSKSKSSKGSTRSSTRTKAPAPKANQGQGVGTAILKGIGKAFGALASSVGWLARSIGGSAKDIDPKLRRDGLGLFLLALAIVAMGGVWFSLPGVSHWLSIGLTTVFGSLAIALSLIHI